MIEVDRETMKSDPVFRKLHELIKAKHVVANHTKRNLEEHKHVKNFCEEARHYVVLPAKVESKSIYLHYDVSSWYKGPDQTAIRIDTIGLYEDFEEYERARVRALYTHDDADRPNQN